MKLILRYIFFASIGLFLIPLLLHLSDRNPILGAIGNFFIVYQNAIWIICLLFGSTSGLVLFILSVKERKAISIIEQAKARDNFWDADYIKQRARLIFYNLYNSLLANNYSQVEPFVTPEFHQEFLTLVPDANASAEKIDNPVDITDTNIVSTSDRIDDSLDEVSVCLRGNFVRPAEGTDPQATTFTVESHPFQVLCKFKRQGIDWKLCQVIDRNVLIRLLMGTRSKFEQ